MCNHRNVFRCHQIGLFWMKLQNLRRNHVSSSWCHLFHGKVLPPYPNGIHFLCVSSWITHCQSNCYDLHHRVASDPDDERCCVSLSRDINPSIRQRFLVLKFFDINKQIIKSSDGSKISSICRLLWYSILVSKQALLYQYPRHLC